MCKIFKNLVIISCLIFCFFLLFHKAISEETDSIKIIGGKIYPFLVFNIGSGPKQLGVTEEGDVLLGPRWFFVQSDGSVIIFDTENSLIKVFGVNGKLLSSFVPKDKNGKSLINSAQHIVRDEHGRYYLGLDKKVLTSNKDGRFDTVCLDLLDIVYSNLEKIVSLEEYDHFLNIITFNKKTKCRNLYVYNIFTKKIVKKEQCFDIIWQQFWKEVQLNIIGKDAKDNYYLFRRLNCNTDEIKIFRLEGKSYKLIKNIEIQYNDPSKMPFEQTIHMSYNVDRMGTIYVLCGNSQKIYIMKIDKY